MLESNDVGLTGAMLRAARALTGVSAAQLAAESGVGERTILRAESHNGRVAMRSENARAILGVFARKGVTFIAEDPNGGSGLRWTEATGVLPVEPS